VVCERRVGRASGVIVVLVTLLVGACAAPRALPPAPTTPRHPDFLYPAVPPGLGDEAVLMRHEGGWRYLQFDNLRNAEREFQAALRAQPAFFPAEAGLGWVELARREPDDALAWFDSALQVDARYVPALVGRGQALLELNREVDALDAFERALAGDAALTDVERRVQVLRFRTLQERVGNARSAAEAGRWDEARTAYLAAIAASPDAAFLYRDLAAVERSAGRMDAALDNARQAVTLDPSDASGHILVAELLEARNDHEGALAAYERARKLDSSPAIEKAWAEARERAEFARMPERYRSIPDAPAVTRADLAALLGVRLSGLLTRAPARQAVVTDVRGHWAQSWVMTAVRTGVIEAFPNYTFQPNAPVRRGDLAVIVSRALSLIAAERPELAAEWQALRPAVADVPPGHLRYPAVALAVASGLMPLDEGGRFHLLQTVSGAEAMAVVRKYLDGRREPLLERLDLRLPAEQRARAGDVGLAHLRVVGRQRAGRRSGSTSRSSDDRLARSPRSSSRAGCRC
jgi:tetratricopeptide (TPR) repeat protein